MRYFSFVVYVSCGVPGALAEADPQAPVPTLVEAPVLVTTVKPAFPDDEQAAGSSGVVELALIIDEHGQVEQANVIHSAGASFDWAALGAATNLEFTPARIVMQKPGASPVICTEELIAAAVSCAPAFAAPVEIVYRMSFDWRPAEPAAGAAVAAPSHVPDAEPSSQRTVVSEVAERRRTASEYHVSLDALSVVPRASAADLLNLAPGVMLSNDGNEGHASHVFMRGFFSEDGRDVALSLEGVPLNDVGNPEAHGYADLSMIIPELVERLDITEGVPDPRQGDFAVAGSVDYQLGLPERGTTLGVTYGMFNTVRGVALVRVAQDSDDIQLGAAAAHSDGYGEARGFDRAVLLAQVAHPAGAVTVKGLVGLSTATWDSPGAVREDDYEAGKIGFYDAYASTRGQGGASRNALVSLTAEQSAPLEKARVSAWGRARDYTLRENFSGYYEHPDAGDLTRFLYRGASVGANGLVSQGFPLFGQVHTFELGFSARHDSYPLSETLMDARTGLPATPADADNVSGEIGALDLGAYADAVLRPTGWLTVRGGVRGDVLGYQVEASTLDILDTSTGAPINEKWDAVATHLGPKVTLELNPGAGFKVMLSHGEGFRSRNPMETKESAAVSTVWGEDLGVRYAWESFSAAASVFHTYVDDDQLFDPLQNEEVPIGPTRRIGGVVWVQAKPLAWIDVNASVTYTYSRADADALDGLLPQGSALPYLAPIVARFDVAAEHEVATWAGTPLQVHGGLGGSFHSPIPLALGETEPTFVVDALAGARFGVVELDVGARNLLGSLWRENVFEAPANFVPGAEPSDEPVQTFTAGTPFNLFATLKLHL